MSVSDLTPLKALRPSVRLSIKYQQILAPVGEVGLVEPPAITPIPNQSGGYFLLDGHLRVEALKELGILEVDCLVATEDDTYSYNKRVNRPSAIQEHHMIVLAMERGVAADRLGKALGLAPATISARFRMLRGICPEAVALLADTACPAAVFGVLRLMKPMRQIAVAELMTGNKNFALSFARGLLSATPASQRVVDPKHSAAAEVTVGSMAKMEREIQALQAQINTVEESYGPDVLHMTVVKGYLRKLLGSATVVKWLARHQPEYLKEFQSMAEMTELNAG